MSTEEERDKSLQLLRDLVAALKEGDYKRAGIVSKLILNSSFSDPTLREALQETYIKCQLHCQKYDEAVCSDDAVISAYAAYKQKDYTKALATKDDSIAMQHIHAQSMFHANDGSVTERFWHLIDHARESDDEKMQILTNTLASLISNATPYCSSDNELCEQVVRSISDFLEDKNVGDDDYPYDLAYNLATLKLLTTPSTSDRVQYRQLLQKAAEACEAVNSNDLTEAELAAELAPIRTNEAIFQSLWNMTTTDFNEIDDSLPVALQTVQKMNRALAQPAHEALKVLMETTPDDDDKLMTALQKRIWYYNRAVLQLRASKYEDCLSTCQFLQTNALMQKSKKKSSAAAAATKNMHLAVHNKEDRAWWESRVSVLLAHVAAKTGKGEATAILDACLENCIALPQSNVRDHAIMYVQLHKAALSTDSSDPIHLLQALLPESLRNKPAVIATAAALYHSAGNDAKASELLQSVGDEQALADFALSQGNYEKAASIYEKAASASSDDPVSKARWVRALSYTDPNKAMKLWSEMSPDLLEEDGDEVNGAELEARELPRFKSTRRNEMVATNDNNTAGKKSKKSHAAVLRQRARKREKYLAEQEKKGLLKPDAKPDPERWLPKYERSNARRRKSRGQPKGGAQGGISEKDAAKLDVVARQAARASGIADSSGPSTAHMTVSGGTGGRKGKRR